jgi:hypothetical protein
MSTDVTVPYGEGESFVADLVVTEPERGTPLIVVEMFDPGSRPPAKVPEAIAASGTQFYFWFDGFADAPDGRPSWGTRYYQLGEDGYSTVPSIPHHHKRQRPRKRRPKARQLCPSCDQRLEQMCLVPCTDDCPGWVCPIFGLLRCAECNKTYPRPGRPLDPTSSSFVDPATIK